MIDYIVVQNESKEDLIELIKLVIGNRTLRKVEEEAGISHGLLGKVIKGNQKASIELLQKLTAENANPQNDVTYLRLMKAADYLPPICFEASVNDECADKNRLSLYVTDLLRLGNDWMKKAQTIIEEKYGVKKSDFTSICKSIRAFEKSRCKDVIFTDLEGDRIWISFLYDDGDNIADKIICNLGRIAFAGADKYLIVTNTVRAIQRVEKAKKSLRQVDLEIETLLIEE